MDRWHFGQWCPVACLLVGVLQLHAHFDVLVDSTLQRSAHMRYPEQQQLFRGEAGGRMASGDARNGRLDFITRSHLFSVQYHERFYHRHVGILKERKKRSVDNASHCTHATTNTHNSYRVRLYEHRFGQWLITGLVYWHTLPGQRLQYGPMVQALVVRVRVDIGQHLTVKRRIAQPDDDLRLQVLLALVVLKEGLAQVVGHSIVVRFRQYPLDGGTLFCLCGKKEERVED